MVENNLYMALTVDNRLAKIKVQRQGEQIEMHIEIGPEIISVTGRNLEALKKAMADAMILIAYMDKDV